MAEPMEEMMEADSTQQDAPAQETSKKSANPLLRPGSMVMMTITSEDYEEHYWPKLEQAINQLLTLSPGQYIPISYEQMYSCVYKCVCKQFSERLYTDLLNFMSSHLATINQELQSCTESSTQFIEKFAFVINQYVQALAGIVPIFNYMNRFYIETKLKTDLNEELRKLFRDNVVDHHISNLLTLLEEANCKPFTIPPATMSQLISNLHSLNSDYAKLKPELFSKYIPNVLPPTCVTNLDQYVQETKKMQEELHSLPGFQQCDSTNSRKRANEEEVPIK